MAKLLCLLALFLALGATDSPTVVYSSYYVSHNRPQGPPMCDGITTIAINTYFSTKDNSPNIASIVYELNSHTILLGNTTRWSQDISSIYEDYENGIITVVIGQMPQNRQFTFALQFDVTVETFYGILFLENVKVRTYIDHFPVYQSNLEPVFFDCQDDTIVVIGDDDLDGGEIAAAVVLSVFGFLLLLLLAFLAIGRGGSQTFTGAGPSQWRENPDG